MGTGSYQRVHHDEPASPGPPSRCSTSGSGGPEDIEYRDVDFSDEMKQPEGPHIGRRRRRFTTRTMLAAVTAASFCTIAITYAIISFSMSCNCPSNTSAPGCPGTPVTTGKCRPPLDPSGYICAPNGAPPAVARARGCEFDTLSFHWYPKAVFSDPENMALLSGFDADAPGGTGWHRYLDSAGTREVKVGEEWAEALTSAWVTRREHMTHCVYTLRQTHLWFEKGWDPPFNYSHTVHCTGYLQGIINEHPPEDIDELKVHAIPYAEHPQVVKPWYPCEEEGLSCVSW